MLWISSSSVDTLRKEWLVWKLITFPSCSKTGKLSGAIDEIILDWSFCCSPKWTNESTWPSPNATHNQHRTERRISTMTTAQEYILLLFSLFNLLLLSFQESSRKNSLITFLLNVMCIRKCFWCASCLWEEVSHEPEKGPALGGVLFYTGHLPLSQVKLQSRPWDVTCSTWSLMDATAMFNVWMNVDQWELPKRSRPVDFHRLS